MNLLSSWFLSRSPWLLAFFLGVSFCFAPNTTAQSSRGSIVGSVSDIQGQPLQGAQLVLTPGGSSSTTDSQGGFAFYGLASGAYTVSVSSVGFSSNLTTVTVGAGQSVRSDVTLKVSSVSQDVQVYADRTFGEAEAINRTVSADNIINVLPAEVITSLPNANIADALGRLPGVTLERDEGEGKYVQIRGTEPRLTNTTIDGINVASPETVRQIKLDLIPADLVESVQINKTLQANMPADGIGGSVDLRTKSAGERPTIALEGTGGYTPIIGGRGAFQLDGTLGKRLLGNKKLGLLGGGSYDWNGRGINDVEPSPAVFGSADIRDYRYYRERLGFAGTVDYRISDTSNIFLKGLYSHFNNFGDRWDYNPQLVNTQQNAAGDDVNHGFISPSQGDGHGTISFGAEVRRPVQDIGLVQLGGHHVIHRSLFSWDVNSSVGRTRDNGYSDATFAPDSADAANPLNNIQYTLNLADPLRPKFDVPSGLNIYDPSHLFYSGERRQFTYLPEVDLGFGGAVATNYTFAGHAGIFELGGRFRNLHKFETLDQRFYSPTANTSDPSLAMSNFLGDFADSGYYDKSYTFGPAVEYAKVRAFSAVTNSRNILGNNFNQVEKVSAGYLMNTLDLNRFRLVLGLRFEETSENNLGYISSGRPSSTVAGPGATPTRQTGSYLDVLPSASLRYSIDQSKALRLVYGRGLSRPNFSDLIPFAQVSNLSSGSSRNSVSIGNPNLRAEHADNIDLLYEQNLSPLGLLQTGIFYKRLSDPIIPVQTTLPQSDPTYPGYLQTQTLNAGSAYVYGFEISFQQHFTYLPSLLSGLGLSTNYGYTASQVTFPATGISRADKPNLLRQAPHTWNISPTFDKGRLQARLGVSYNAANIYAYNYSSDNAGAFNYQDGSGGGIKGPNGDQYFYTHLQTDVQGTYRLGRGFSALVYGLNLNNEVFGFYQGSGIYPIQREFYKTTVGGGVRWSSHAE